MAEWLLIFLALAAPGAPAAAERPVLPLLQSVDLDAEALRDAPSLLAGGTLALRLESRREGYFKLSERGEVLAAGRLLVGTNRVRFDRPGLVARSQSLLFLLELLEGGNGAQKFLRLQVAVGGGPEAEARERAPLSGAFRLEMYHEGTPIGFRKKRLEELYELKTGTVAPVPDPGLSGSAIRSQPPSQGISVLGLGMALAKYLGRKRTGKKLDAHEAEMRKKKLSLSIPRDGGELPVVIELRVE